MSVNKIAEIIGVSKSTTSRWLKDVPLTADQRHQLMENSKSYGAQHQGSVANKVKHRKIREQYQQAGREKARENDPLHLTGCMLYWAEGTKRRDSCTFTNSDPQMMKIYMEFSRKCLHINDTDVSIRIDVYLHNDLTLQDIEAYWLELLELTQSAIKSGITKQSKDEHNGRKLPYGTCKIRLRNGTQYVQHILGAIQEYRGIDRPEWLD